MFRTSIKLSVTDPEFYNMQKVEVFESVFEKNISLPQRCFPSLNCMKNETLVVSYGLRA